ncbi:hypothetical protein CLV98_102354 [Dyadobacter jejuensis]|uniref:Uncharacterized protein n=2 Tax=Dyadobacter jejuensis TaxID=1082580 RepID=A0A316ARR0_9BACT|nr:hypothetical protein CLV98_102354 [Dyadobacter jejuensis]
MSIVFLVGSLLWTYSVFPEMVAVDFSNTGVAELYIGKESIFYIVMGIFLVNNVLISRLTKQIPFIDAAYLPIPNRKAWAQNRPVLNELVANWLNALMGAINTITGVSLMAVATINSEQYKLDVFDFSWVFYLSVALMLLVFLLPLRMLKATVPDETI